jgi:hypothetical protein
MHFKNRLKILKTLSNYPRPPSLKQGIIDPYTQPHLDKDFGWYWHVYFLPYWDFTGPNDNSFPFSTKKPFSHFLHFYSVTKTILLNWTKLNEVYFEQSMHQNKLLSSEALWIPVTTIALTSSLLSASSKLSFKLRNTGGRERGQTNEQTWCSNVVWVMEEKKGEY